MAHSNRPALSTNEITWGRGLLSVFLLGLSLPMGVCAQQSDAKATLPFDPPTYVVYRTGSGGESADPVTVDGRLDEEAWRRAAWTESFVDIRGGKRPAPPLRTKAKMLWNDRHFLIAAKLEEPHLWATRTDHDTVVYRDDAFEVFVDPSGDTHNYYEIQVNLLETVRDLFLVQPFRDGGPPIGAWDVRDLEIGVHLKGTLNDPTDMDEGWTVELALPWEVLVEAAPERRRPADGDRWRLNFARPDWPLEVVGQEYQKREKGAAHWSSWVPQGAIDMHMPERFGYVQFSERPVGDGETSVVDPPNEELGWALRRLYYRQRDYLDTHGHYARDLAELNAGEITVQKAAGADIEFEPTLQVTESSYEITTPGVQRTTVHIRHDGKVWTTSR